MKYLNIMDFLLCDLSLRVGSGFGVLFLCNLRTSLIIGVTIGFNVLNRSFLNLSVLMIDLALS
jgi:hypothetical protein